VGNTRRRAPLDWFEPLIGIIAEMAEAGHCLGTIAEMVEAGDRLIEIR
jgi:hypothetical protein